MVGLILKANEWEPASWLLKILAIYYPWDRSPIGHASSRGCWITMPAAMSEIPLQESSIQFHSSYLLTARCCSCSYRNLNRDSLIFWLDPRDVLHFDILFPPIQELCPWTEKLTLVKVKSHSGCQLNEMADDRDNAGCTSDAEPIYPWQQKYGSLLLSIRPLHWNQIAGEKTCH